MMATNAKRLLGRFLFSAFEMLRRKPARAERGNVVIVRADGIGDLVYSLPVLESIRRAYAPKRCILVCNSAVASFIKDQGVVDEVLPFDKGRYRWDPIYRLSVWKMLRGLTPSVAISLGYHRSPTSEELTLATGADTTICMSGNDEMILDSDRRGFDRRYTRVIRVPDHVAEQKKYEILVRSEGWPEVDWGREYPPRPRPEDVLGMDGAQIVTRPVIAFCPGGSAPIRLWPLEKWIDLIRGFISGGEVECRLVGGMPDSHVLELVASKVGKPITTQVAPDVRSLATSLAEADLVVGLDSGPSHIAVRSARPTVVILGGGHFSRYFPYGTATICNAVQECYECNWRCTRDKNYCLTEITVEQVRSEVTRRLSEGV